MPNLVWLKQLSVRRIDGSGLVSAGFIYEVSLNRSNPGSDAEILVTVAAPAPGMHTWCQPLNNLFVPMKSWLGQWAAETPTINTAVQSSVIAANETAFLYLTGHYLT